MNKLDKYGFERSSFGSCMNMGSSKGALYTYIKVLKENVKMWVEPKKTESGKIVYVVSKSIRNVEISLGKDGSFTTKIITQFDDSISAREWVNKEYFNN